MLYKILADIVVITHFLWIFFLIFGAFLGVRYRAIKIFHISGLVFAVVIQIFDWHCPLTHLEVWLRERHNPALSYTGSFIIHYLEKMIYIELSRWIVFVMTVLICSLSAWVYLRKSSICARRSPGKLIG
ncbi:MAG: DUF2784 domain-containing protein [Nitrospirae bacterium]|nr:DUF2784 domain-containing protein [Nitrospirota bacterium]